MTKLDLNDGAIDYVLVKDIQQMVGSRKPPVAVTTLPPLSDGKTGTESEKSSKQHRFIQFCKNVLQVLIEQGRESTAKKTPTSQLTATSNLSPIPAILSVMKKDEHNYYRQEEGLFRLANLAVSNEESFLQ